MISVVLVSAVLLVMADGSAVPPSGVDLRSNGSVTSRRKGESLFTWIALSPSSAEVAGLELQFSEIIQLLTAAIDREAEDWSSYGLIVRTLSRWVPPEAVIREFRRAGLADRIDSISLAHRTTLLKFELPAARCAALLQPWVVNGQPLAMEVWRLDFVPANDALRTALLWICLPNLPLEYWNEETLRSILLVAGQFVEADAFTKERRRESFACASVRVDLSKPLRPGARIRAHGPPFWQQFAYEHVDCICAHYGSLHMTGACSFSSAPGSSAAAPKFGPWMAALRHRKLSPVV